MGVKFNNYKYATPEQNQVMNHQPLPEEPAVPEPGENHQMAQVGDDENPPQGQLVQMAQEGDDDPPQGQLVQMDLEGDDETPPQGQLEQPAFDLAAHDWPFPGEAAAMSQASTRERNLRRELMHARLEFDRVRHTIIRNEEKAARMEINLSKERLLRHRQFQTISQQITQIFCLEQELRYLRDIALRDIATPEERVITFSTRRFSSIAFTFITFFNTWMRWTGYV